MIKDAKRPLVDDYRTHAKNYGDHKETYNGADFNVNWRMGNGGTVGGGLTWGDAHINDCYVVDDPTQLRFCDRTVDPNGGLVRGGLQVKLLGSYPLPGGWQASATFQSVRGPEITAGLDQHHVQQHDPVPEQHADQPGRDAERDGPVDRAGDAVRRPAVSAGPARHEDVRQRKHPRQADGGSLQRAERQRRAAALARSAGSTPTRRPELPARGAGRSAFWRGGSSRSARSSTSRRRRIG